MHSKNFMFFTPPPIEAEMQPRNSLSVNLGAAITSLLLSKRMSNCRPRYINSLKTYLSQFSRDRESQLLDTFDVFEIERWFTNRTEALSTMSSNIGRLSALFGFCERRGWIAKNPCKQLERIRIDRKAPRILSLEQSALLIRYIAANKPNELAFFTLSMFAGIRPEELERIGWDAVNLERGIVTIDAAASKVRQRRIVDLEPTTVQWLKAAKAANSRLPVLKMTRRRYLDHAERLLGFTGWPQDCLRHTAASFLLAKLKDAPQVADRLGNSPGILLRHYRELVNHDDCLAFWALAPTDNQ